MQNALLGLSGGMQQNALAQPAQYAPARQEGDPLPAELQRLGYGAETHQRIGEALSDHGEIQPQQLDEYNGLPDEEKRQFWKRVIDGLSIDEALRPQDYQNPAQLTPFDDSNLRAPLRGSNFNDAAAVRTADMSGVAPSGVGERSNLNATARAYQTLMKGLAEYEAMFDNGGSTMWPGARKDMLDTAHRDLQMQMKELYNLGVLNGPDLDLMNQILLSPTSIGGNVMDALGVADMEERIPANINSVRRMMRNLATPTLQQLGLDPADFEAKAPAPPQQPTPSDTDGWTEINGVKIRVKR